VCAHAAVAFVFHQTERPGLGHREIHPGQAYVGIEEFLAEHLAGHGGEFVHVLGVLCVLDLLAELARDLVLVLVDGRHDDVARRFAVELDDVLAQIGFQGLDAALFQEGIEMHLLRDHALALDQGPGALGLEDAQDELIGLLAGLGPLDLDAVPGGLGLELLQEIRQVQQAARPDGRAEVPQILQVAGIRELRQALGHETVHGPAEVRPELGIQQGLGGGVAEAHFSLSVHGCAPRGTRRCAGHAADCVSLPRCHSH
jgi:hypothetical protein